MGLFAPVEVDEESVGRSGQIIVRWQLVRDQGRSAQEFGQDFRPVLIRKRLELVKQLLGSLRHEIRLAPAVCHVKFRW